MGASNGLLNSHGLGMGLGIGHGGQQVGQQVGGGQRLLDYADKMRSKWAPLYLHREWKARVHKQSAPATLGDAQAQAEITETRSENIMSTSTSTDTKDGVQKALAKHKVCYEWPNSLEVLNCNL